LIGTLAQKHGDGQAKHEPGSSSSLKNGPKSNLAHLNL
jgi:hypothetical protein